MKTPVTAFTAVSQWLDSFRAMFPGGPPAAPKELTPKEAQVEANQEWEDEGGSIKPPAAQAGVAPAPKIPL